MIINFFDYSTFFFFLFFLLLFIILNNKIIGVIISLMLSSMFIGIIMLRLTYEYISFIYLIIYFGAILMLFLFIIMLLDIDNSVFSVDYYINKNITFLFFIAIKIIFLLKSFIKIFHISDYDIINNDEFLSFSINLLFNFSIFEFFLTFFNFYWIWLVLVGWVLLIVMVGLVYSLIDTHINLIKLYTTEKNIWYIDLLQWTAMGVVAVIGLLGFYIWAMIWAVAIKRGYLRGLDVFIRNVCHDFMDKTNIPEMGFYTEGQNIYKFAQAKSGIITGFWPSEKVVEYESRLCENKVIAEKNLKLPADQQIPLHIVKFPEIDDGIIPEDFLIKLREVTVRVDAHFLRVFAFAIRVHDGQKDKSITKKEYKEMCKRYSYPSIYVPWSFVNFGAMYKIFWLYHFNRIFFILTAFFRTQEGLIRQYAKYLKYAGLVDAYSPSLKPARLPFWFICRVGGWLKKSQVYEDKKKNKKL